ncbi:hypothetical protein [Pseudoalteromonas prydzensis]|jgi:hypothetical protein|uniref:hypothetical protein n=1 Tax=Pseudoalteromonas prydzensis TaxID=182141 RepID=UPI000A00E6D9|nr:hypothetical protein [Pseudoalteromonas prydzensis]|eukprot:TRINITY_DN2478_c0_g1_i8.p3 TRINITY_DN2478_c0_g1~~TRINITY_DN2478_c0_g1_i8.p3  ORF type:complete len:161 (-),score=47.17 TRINITY_DN2478_c0_g1_i8:118-600(-)
MKMNKPDFDTFLAESINNSDSDITPQKDLWPGIEKALAHAPQPQVKASLWPKITGVAACSVAALLAVQLLFSGAEPATSVAMSEYFTQQKQTLLVQYQNQPALTDNWQQQLAELEDAERAIKQALENEPQSPALLKMLAQVYQQQLDLINKVHAPKWQQI